jgi:hypothetical protein
MILPSVFRTSAFSHSQDPEPTLGPSDRIRRAFRQP